MRTTVITIAHGRHEHWRRQRAGLAQSADAARHVLVAIDDPWFEDDGAHPELRILRLDAAPDGLPLARARNAGARAALDDGAELLIFLDVDCIPSRGLVGGYRAAARDAASNGHLLCGPVTYLPPAGPEGYALDRLPALDAPHPARPAPAPGQVTLGGPYELFWSLSFAVGASTWDAIGGFDEVYSGYGGEDTDFGQRARRAGVELAWVGSARAYHQHHPVEDPPTRHLDDILRNGALFAERWGWWPMGGWIDEFERMRLIERVDGGYRRVSA
jgi:hypothetical protein